MVRRLLEVNYFENRENPTREQIRFWFLELRTPDLLIELAAEQGRIPAHLRRQRPLLELATTPTKSLLANAVIEEEQREREADQQYWIPLKKELERLPHARVSRAKR
jgi:hypothetical protein